MQELKNRFKNIEKNEWEEFLKKLEKVKVETDLLDLNSADENSNIENLYDFVKVQYGIELRNIAVELKQIKSKQEKYNHLLKQQLDEQEEIAEQEFNKVLEKIENEQTTQILEDLFFTTRQFAKMVANGNVRGLLLYGESGLGKTFSVIRAFREVGKTFKIISGHITSLELFHILYQFKDDNLILDDINILDNENNLNLLKSCLSDNSKIVQYHTTSDKLRVPSKFVFNGTITIILNSIPSDNNPNFKAVQSRILNFELKLSYKDKIKILFELAKSDYKDLNLQERLSIAKWIKDNTGICTKNLNLRLLFLVYEMYRFDETSWEKLAKEIIVNDERLKIVEELLKKYPVVKEAEKEFIEMGYGCRASFYNLKKKLYKV